MNLLILENNPYKCKYIFNYISNSKIKINLCNIAYTSNEAIKILNRNNINIIFIDFDTLTIPYENLLNFIFNKFYVIISVTNITINSSKTHCKMYTYKNIKTALNFLVDFVLKHEQSEKYIKEKIVKELKILGYNIEYLGTKYLLETIYILSILKDYNDNNLEKDIYPIVAKKYGKTVHNIKCNIRNATEIMYYDNQEELIIEYLKDYKNSKIGTKIIILAILKKVKN